MGRQSLRFNSKVLTVPVRDWLSGPFAKTALPVLLCSALSVSSAQAAVTGEAGTIEGRKPTVTGNLFVTGPDGDVLSEAMLDAASTPNSYSVSADLSELILNDADGDSGLTAELNLPKPNLVWKDGTRTLGTTELNQTFREAGTLGKLLTVTVSPSVKVSTTTGMPRIATTVLPQTYRFFPQGSWFGFSANSVAFPRDSGFPTTGFVGAFYQNVVEGIWNSNQINYTWTTSQPGWMTVDDNGRVTFTNKPTLAQRTYTITATPKAGGSPPITLTTTLKSWFSKPNTGQYSWQNANVMCNGISAKSRLPLVSELTSAPKSPLGTPGSRDMGSLWGEWGNLYSTVYKGTGFMWGSYWSSEANGNGEYYAVNAVSGTVDNSTGNYTTCIEPL
ncbi:hypothetical protein H8I69_18595 [Serratia fonticola]|uniref:hypothetical protein n=1 Tax=Serratia fonticola TaxID=47917 RepID=UPI0015C6775C|nr:hypothetical protein [Serratia fonticola]MBC3381133.1 hypothetical protein [Serratia fonticola]NYA40332.1 hypothetical protein [Serratia fonticola]